MTTSRLLAICLLYASALSSLGGCGGGSGTPAPQDPPLALPPPPTTVQSPGGDWFVLAGSSDPVHLYISESGKVRAIFDIAGVTDGPTFGGGSVEITGNDMVTGVLQARGILPSAGSPSPRDLSCALSGTVRERDFLSVNIVCSDSNQVVFDRDFTLRPQPGYDAGSSLDAIAGNYTLPFRPETNMLNVAADGTLFGTYHNGANCTVNGIVSIIDADYAFLDVEWTMSNCIDPFGIYEGAVVSGFAMESPNPNDPPGSFYFLLTGMNASDFFAISVNYEPT